MSDVTAWFFDDYLPTWVGVGNGTIHRGPEFILDYWGHPLFVANPDAAAGWALDGPAVVEFLGGMQARLRADGYTHTEVLDRSVHVYHDNGAAIEVIWSRRRADESEIERMAVHFEAIRTIEGWRIAGIQYLFTTAETLAESWAQR
ncbi:hypothetical protein [Kutzneria sp. NPDC051319]|uniref:DUF6841 family protein n=1 Tax=Kutzneria sp. NPDC051319 TaxID=3155047 RepID=UPI003444B890